MWVPHVEQYDEALAGVAPGDVVCDMGAGDLRFAVRACERASKVYAVEANPQAVALALDVLGYEVPRNLVVVCADWWLFPVPPDVTVVTCLVNINATDLPARWAAGRRRVLLGWSSAFPDSAGVRDVTELVRENGARWGGPWEKFNRADAHLTSKEATDMETKRPGSSVHGKRRATCPDCADPTGGWGE